MDLSVHIQTREALLVQDESQRAIVIELKETSTTGNTRCGLLSWQRAAGCDDVEDADTLWVDRFDARLLLTDLPSVQMVGGEDVAVRRDETWDDLPSDAEDVFFLSPSEISAYRRDKRLRLMEQQRQERLRSLQDEENVRGVQECEGASGDNAITGLDTWGDSDEEPDEPQLLLMTRTATHIRNSPNRTLLEMRILANHGADPRFAFLKGRWKKRWSSLLSEESSKPPTDERKLPASSSVGLVEGYSSDDD
ncbi:hypothetical protein FRB99_000312 [Tulasnella sp. 403]|nr:hypothetical protein FRB99_000312 [Tulasnella sp. 403]